MSTLKIARFFITALPLASLLVARASANVIVVGPGLSYTQIQPAVDAASDGDTILVKPGTYTGFSITNKALAVVGDTGSAIHVQGGIRVRNLDAAKTVTLIRLSSFGVITGGLGPNGLKLSNNLGSVRVERCGLNGASFGVGSLHGYGGVSVSECSDVAFQSCTLSGGASARGSFPDVGTAGPGAVVVGSVISIYDSLVAGGNGQDAAPCSGAYDGGNGGDAFYGDAMTLVASGSTFIGGSGGDAVVGCSCGSQTTIDASAGVALHLGDTPFTFAYMLGNAEQGGWTGDALGQLCNPYPGGPMGARSGHTFINFTGTSRKMDSPNPMRENAVGQVTFTGVPGERVALLVADEPDHVLQVPWKGMLLVKTHHPLLSVPMGTIPASGTLVTSMQALALNGLAAKTLYMQALFVGPGGQRTLGSASTLVILNQAY